MKREWKPGDVAIVTTPTGAEHVAVLTDRGDLEPLWIAGDERWWARRNECEVRAVVVIDPEDREQVERLLDAYFAATISGATSLDDMQAALREFASPTPPKPDEPTGLGAVVEDATGKRWVRKGNTPHGEDWACQIGNAWTSDTWSRILTVRVLSEGVQP